MLISFSLLAGAMALVLGGILIFRLHAFLALVFASLIIATLTPAWLTQGYYLSTSGGVAVVDPATGGIEGSPPGWASDGLEVALIARSGLNTEWERVGTTSLKAAEPSGDSPFRVTELQTPESEYSSIAVFPSAGWATVQSATARSVGDRIASGFGSTAGKIGILIALASVIGSCLLTSGAASRIIHSLIHLFGEKRASLGFVIGSFLVGIPVFFDTVFYLMIPLARAYFKREGRGYLLCLLSIVAGATMAHSLVPPTPGPMQVASELGVSIGLMMMAGLGMGLITVTTGYLLAVWMDRRSPIPCREFESDHQPSGQQDTHDSGHTGPSLLFSLLPILLPVLLISAGTITGLDEGRDSPLLSPEFHRLIGFLANKNIALAVSAVSALILVVRHGNRDRKAAASDIQGALMSGGVILLITAAGGGFGQVLKETGITLWAGKLTPGGTPWSILLAFGVTSMIRIAQGSATVAMVTAVGVVQPLVAAGALGFHPVYLALAIGCGSKPIPWMNDSGFWLISRMGGLTEKETLRTASVMMTAMGVVGGLVVFLIAWVFPGV